jgi:hypothetical protein
MELWEQLLAAALVLAMIFFVAPNIKGAMQKSRESESDWGTIALLTLVLIGFIMLLVYSVRS